MERIMLIEGVRFMAKETFAIDVYLDKQPKIATALKIAAQQALEICKK